jgi:hypothetical protein
MASRRWWTTPSYDHLLRRETCTPTMPMPPVPARSELPRRETGAMEWLNRYDACPGCDSRGLGRRAVLTA